LSTRTLLVDDTDALTAAAAALLGGEVVILPTDTVYGLAAVPDQARAVHNIFLAKDRPAQFNLPVLASSLDQVRQLGVSFTADAAALAARWWPGPLTMAFGFSEDTERPGWLAHREEVAVRIPDHPFVRALLERTGVLLVTSANRHGSATPPSPDEVAKHLAPHVSLLIDGGTLASTPSTLVNVHQVPSAVEREGAIARQDIASTLEAAP
jgi:L-threonylcarbamoyladenylate synthase